MVHFRQIVSFIFGQDFLRHEQETLKANASQIDQALQALDPVQCTLGPEWIRGHVVMDTLVCEVRWLRYAEECKKRMGGNLGRGDCFVGNYNFKVTCYFCAGCRGEVNEDKHFWFQ